MSPSRPGLSSSGSVLSSGALSESSTATDFERLWQDLSSNDKDVRLEELNTLIAMVKVLKEENDELNSEVKRLLSKNETQLKDNKALKLEIEELKFDNRTLWQDRKELIASSRIQSDRSIPDKDESSCEPDQTESSMNSNILTAHKKESHIECSLKLCQVEKYGLQSQIFSYLGEIKNLTDANCDCKLYEEFIKRKTLRLEHLIMTEGTTILDNASYKNQQEILQLLREINTYTIGSAFLRIPQKSSASRPNNTLVSASLSPLHRKPNLLRRLSSVVRNISTQNPPLI